MNISDSKSPANYLALISASVIIEMMLLVIYKLYPNYWGNLINHIYTNYTITVIIIDILSLLMAFSVSQQIYEYFYGHTYWNILAFIVILFIYQILRNILFYYIIPKYLDNQKDEKEKYSYGSSNYSHNYNKILLSCVIIAVVLPLLTSFMKSIYISYQFDFIILGFYVICYILLNYNNIY
jgi:hypothetical protein